MYKIIGKCLCGGNVIKAEKSKPQCMSCFNKPPKLRMVDGREFNDKRTTSRESIRVS